MKQPRKKSKAAKSLHDLTKMGQKWIERVEAAGETEKDWMDDAKKAVEAYTGERGESDTSAAAVGSYDFNILFANVETIVPAVINSAPAPDIRRRFGDADPVAKAVSEIIERAIRVQVDDSRLQTELEAAAQDAFLAGRGVVRIRFHSDIIGGEPTRDDIEDAAEGETEEDEAPSGYGEEPEDEDQGEDLTEGEGLEDDQAAMLGQLGAPQMETLANERISFEAISWVDYRHGPAKRWDERPWDAFRFCIPREDEDKSFDRNLIRMQLDTADYNNRLTDGSDLTGWEVWCKESRKVYFIDDAGIILKTIDDPLGLSKFFPIATPVQPIEVNGRLMPVNPFSIYRRLADDLDDAVRRKNVLVKAMKAKGWYGLSQKDMEAVLELNDNEFTPINDPELWATTGGIQNAIAFWPFEKFIAAIQQLDAAIAQYKQWIYEITGISDIVRGASVAAETATAQNIKSQWGSLRIQKMQRMMERCARDLFIMMAEIIPAKFSPQTLQEMTSIPILPLPEDTPEIMQMKASVMALLKRNLTRFYRIDVESDSTVRADLTRQKQEVAGFMQATAQYFQAVGPLVQQGAMPADAAVEIFAANSRMFNLGKSVEDTLEQMVVKAKQMAGKPPQKPPSPAEQQMKMAMEMAQVDAKIKMQDAQIRGQEAQRKAQLQSAEFQAKMAEAARKAQADGVEAQQQAVINTLQQELKRMELQIKQMDVEIKSAELAAKRMEPVAGAIGIMEMGL